MFVRKLSANDIISHEKIASQSFVFSTELKELDSLPSENMFGVFDENNVLMADLEAGHRECCFNGHILSCTAVGGVACKPEFRNKGAVSILMKYLNENEETDISVLYPFSTAFYSRFGYACVGKKLSFKISMSAYSHISRSTDVELLEYENESILTLYNNCASNLLLCFKRTDFSYFSCNPYSSMKYTYYWKYKNNKPGGYVTFTLNRKDKIIVVHEIFSLDIESFTGLIGFLNNFNGNYDYIEFECVPENTPALKLASEIKPVVITSAYSGQVRINNLYNVLKCLKSDFGCFNLSVFCTDNNTGYYLSFDNGISNVSIVDNNDYDFDIISDLLSLSSLIFDGIFSFEDACSLTGLKIINKKPEILSVFRKKPCFFVDGF